MLNHTRAKVVAVGAGAVVMAASLAACGGSSGGSDASSGSQPQVQPSAGGNFQEVQQCLDAAGIKLKLPSGAPSGFAGGTPPSGAPTGAPPSGAPSFDPGQSPPGGAGAGLFNNPKVQRALKACGIELPSAP
jgi:hypothetical protein